MTCAIRRVRDLTDQMAFLATTVQKDLLILQPQVNYLLNTLTTR